MNPAKKMNYSIQQISYSNAVHTHTQNVNYLYVFNRKKDILVL